MFITNKLSIHKVSECNFSPKFNFKGRIMITSKDNQIVKHIKSLSQKKYRDEYEEYIVEGLKMSLEAINYSEICYVVVSQEFEKQDEYNTLKKEITK